MTVAARYGVEITGPPPGDAAAGDRRSRSTASSVRHRHDPPPHRGEQQEQHHVHPDRDHAARPRIVRRAPDSPPPGGRVPRPRLRPLLAPLPPRLPLGERDRPAALRAQRPPRQPGRRARRDHPPGLPRHPGHPGGGGRPRAQAPLHPLAGRPRLVPARPLRPAGDRPARRQPLARRRAAGGVRRAVAAAPHRVPAPGPRGLRPRQHPGGGGLDRVPAARGCRRGGGRCAPACWSRRPSPSSTCPSCSSWAG